MGFLSAWDSTERIDVSDLVHEPFGTWWIDVKKCLTHGESDNVMRHLMSSTMQLGDPTNRGAVPVKTSLSVDAVVDHQELLVAKSIDGWNLPDENGEILPITPFEALENSLALLPSPVYARVAEVVVAANTEKSEDTAPFSSKGSGGGSIGLDYAPDDSEVLV